MSKENEIKQEVSKEVEAYVFFFGKLIWWKMHNEKFIKLCFNKIDGVVGLTFSKIFSNFRNLRIFLLVE